MSDNFSVMLFLLLSRFERGCGGGEGESRRSTAIGDVGAIVVRAGIHVCAVASRMRVMDERGEVRVEVWSRKVSRVELQGLRVVECDKSGSCQVCAIIQALTNRMNKTKLFQIHQCCECDQSARPVKAVRERIKAAIPIRPSVSGVYC